MSLIRVAGKIVNPSMGNVQWKIPYDGKMCEMLQNFCITSPPFNFLERSWHLRFYPNGVELNKGERFFDVYLCVQRPTQPLPLNVCFNLSLDDIGEALIQHRTFVVDHTFSNDNWHCAWENILQSMLVWNKTRSSITISCFATKGSLPMFTFYRSMCRKTHLSENLKQIYDDQLEADVTFSVQGREFKAHKLILAARSRRFDEIFDGSENDCISYDWDPDAFETLLLFLYTGTVAELPWQKVINLYSVARHFCTDLADICARYFEDRMSEDTYEEILELAVRNNDKWLENETRRFHENITMDDAEG